MAPAQGDGKDPPGSLFSAGSFRRNQRPDPPSLRNLDIPALASEPEPTSLTHVVFVNHQRQQQQRRRRRRRQLAPVWQDMGPRKAAPGVYYTKCHTAGARTA